MTKLEYATSFRDLIVYRKTIELSLILFLLTKQFPREETYSLTDQIRRFSRSVGAQIAEAWAKRKYQKHFVSKLTDADGEPPETQHWLEIAYDCGYISQGESKALLEKCSEIGCLLGGMICSRYQTREVQEHYSVTSTSSLNTEH